MPIAVSKKSQKGHHHQSTETQHATLIGPPKSRGLIYILTSPRKTFPGIRNISEYTLTSRGPSFTRWPCIRLSSGVRRVIRSHIGEAFANVYSINIVASYKLSEKGDTFNTRWMSNFLVAIKDILKSWWHEPSKLWVKADQVYRTEGLRKVYQLMDAMMNQLYGAEY